mgnify:CR=1 FL=1
MTHIKKTRAVVTAPAGIDLVIVVVETDQPGLVGYGCATFTQRASAVAEVVNRYLDPLLRDRDAGAIEDIWRVVHANSYWRGGPVTNNALGGVDMALWDIKGKEAGMPVYRLLGGPCRDRVDVYRHADGATTDDVIRDALRLEGEGHRFIRCQVGGYGGAGAMRKSADAESSTTGAGGALADRGIVIDPKRYIELTVEMLHEVRNALGHSVELLHDIHERVPLAELPRFAHALDDVGLFFLEDAVPLEHTAWLAEIRRASTVPIAIGELFTGPEHWMPLIENRLVDFIRVHLSHIGGITPAKKLAALCEAYGVRTAWHGPGDCSPFGHAANLHVDMAVPNFGIQEYYEPPQVLDEVFSGFPKVTDGALRPTDAPGLGVTFNEEAALRYPPALTPPTWTQTRLSDGTQIYP